MEARHGVDAGLEGGGGDGGGDSTGTGVGHWCSVEDKPECSPYERAMRVNSCLHKALCSNVVEVVGDYLCSRAGTVPDEPDRDHPTIGVDLADVGGDCSSAVVKDLLSANLVWSETAKLVESSQESGNGSVVVDYGILHDGGRSYNFGGDGQIELSACASSLIEHHNLWIVGEV